MGSARCCEPLHGRKGGIPKHHPGLRLNVGAGADLPLSQVSSTTADSPATTVPTARATFAPTTIGTDPPGLSSPNLVVAVPWPCGLSTPPGTRCGQRLRASAGVGVEIVTFSRSDRMARAADM